MKKSAIGVKRLECGSLLPLSGHAATFDSARMSRSTWGSLCAINPCAKRMECVSLLALSETVPRARKREQLPSQLQTLQRRLLTSSFFTQPSSFPENASLAPTGESMLGTLRWAVGDPK